jgi:UDP-N-acetylmuramyl pentapeptide phosphotransferase/UDP-N-acetylglucosamine-1-phosphate transferase
VTALVASLVATLVSLPVVMALLHRYSVLDVPNERSSHTSPVHRGAGLACMVGVVVGTCADLIRGSQVPWVAVGLAVCLGLIGLADDLRGLGQVPRLCAQIVVGATTGWVIGHGVGWILLGLIVIPVAVNVVNFMDGIDGITSLTVAVWGLSVIVIGLTHHHHELVEVGGLAVGASLGFLPVNWPRAKLFLGDVGSYLLGGLVGLGVLVGLRAHVPVIQLLAAMLPYLVDTGWTFARRAIRRAPLMTAHREHVYQRLVSQSGLSHTAVAALVAGLAAAEASLWIWADSVLATPASICLLAGYLMSPRAMSRHQRGIESAVRGNA